MRFSAYVVFITLWSLVVYARSRTGCGAAAGSPSMGALDFAGGTVVHVNAGVAALVAAIVRRQAARLSKSSHCCRITCRSRCSAPACCGSAGSASTPAARSAASPIAAARLHDNLPGAGMGTLVVWTLLDVVRIRQADRGRRATGIVVGLVAVTPAAGFIGPMSAIVLGAIAAFPSYFGLSWRAKTQLDDSLDVVAAHGRRWHGRRVADWRLRAEERSTASRTDCCSAIRRSSAFRPSPVACGHRLQRRRELHPAEGDRRR